MNHENKKDWTRISLKEFFSQHRSELEHSQEADKKTARDVLEEATEKYGQLAVENAKQLDKHMVWITGGALALIVTVISSEEVLISENLTILIPAIFALGLCLIFVISSYRAEAIVLNGIPKMQKLMKNLLAFMYSYKDGDDFDKAWNKAEWKWWRLQWTAKMGKFLVQVTSWLNTFAYVSFLVGMVSLLTYGIMMVQYLSQSQMNDHQSNGQNGNSAPEHEGRFSSQTAGVVFEQVASSVASNIASGVNNSPMASSQPTNPPPSSQPLK